MAMCDVSELFDYWREYPPQHILMRGYVGYEGPGRSVAGPDARAELAALNPRTGGRARKLSQASEHVRKMAESLKRAKDG
jgi:hypothetical protein